MKTNDKLLKEERRLGKVFLKWRKVQDSYRSDLENMIAGMVSRMGGSIDPTDQEADDPDYIHVSYDGGRNPEYNSTMYARVDMIRCVGGKFEVDLEQENHVSCDRLDINDILVIQQRVSAMYASCDAVISDRIKAEFGKYIDKRTFTDTRGQDRIVFEKDCITVFLDTHDRRCFPQRRIDRIVEEFNDVLEFGEFQYDPRTKPMLVFQRRRQEQ